MNNEPKSIEIELSPEVAEGTYSNLAVIAHSSSEFVIDFVRILPGVAKHPVKSRIVLTPESAKRLMFALEENVMRYEQQMGNIRVNEPNTVATPFMKPEGKA